MKKKPLGSHLITLEEAQVIIKRQAAEIGVLQAYQEKEQFAQKLRQLLISSSVTSTILSPFTQTQLLELVMRTATQVISARSGSLFLIDQEANDLVFEVAIGPAAHNVKKFRVPLGHGFAGLVAISGQPMAISNTQNDERLATDIAASVNYIPESILCVPLFYDDRIIGVLELLDKIDAPSFSMNDMHNLGLFAGIASIAIVQSQAYKDEQSILTGLLRIYCQEHKTEEKKQMYDESQTFVNWLNQGDTLNSKSREMARLVQDLILSGEQECELCLNILQSVSTYTRQQTVSYL